MLFLTKKSFFDQSPAQKEVLTLSGWELHYVVREFANTSAASAACPDYVKFQAVIKSAASAASRKPKSSEGSSRGAPDGGSAGGRRPWGAPLELPSLDLGFLEAALAALSADLITA